LENIYKPIKMNFGEKSKKEEFRRPIPITPVKILPVTPIKIPAAAGKAHEEPSKTVGPAGDNLYQREEIKLMVDSEASSTSSEKGEISIMEEGEFSDDDDDMNGLQNNSEKNLKGQ